ncbi:methyltransferase domain-containing protein [Thermogemmatispora onikobensis]|uniref:methyltransferase domain-containing protein n=1 Tax=Thermogemmatispora onikobensis TaxID=732234 RepID=UPI000853C0A3|nr:methyltransferase domain-containing protein [Thermogemmatispora onikobensis]
MEAGPRRDPDPDPAHRNGPGQHQDQLEAQQQALVEHLKERGFLRTARIEAAFRAVPRHLFLPGVPSEEVYRDQVIPLKIVDGVCISSSSQPAIMAIMLEQLGLEPGQRVLEIGAASGYNAALMAHILGESGTIVTIDIDEDLVEGARAHLEAAGYRQVHVICGDGAQGYPPAAPYDRIILTVAAGDIATPWYEQLKPDGRLLLPLVLRDAQFSVALERRDDHLESVSVRFCAFMMLRGPFAEAGGIFALGPRTEASPALQLRLNNYQPVDVTALYRDLAGPWYDLPSGVLASLHEVHYGFNSWLSQQEPTACSLVAQREHPALTELPWLFKVAGLEARATIGIVADNHVALLALPPGWRVPASGASQSGQVACEIMVRCFGGAEYLARRLLSLLRSWDTAGRPASWLLMPGDDRLRLRVYPLHVPCPEKPTPERLIFTRRWSRLVIERQA